MLKVKYKGIKVFCSSCGYGNNKKYSNWILNKIGQSKQEFEKEFYTNKLKCPKCNYTTLLERSF